MRTKKSKTPTLSPLVQAAVEKVFKKPFSRVDDSDPVPSAITNPEESSNSDHTREADQALDLQEVKEITDDELQKELKRFLIPKLRSASYRWKFRSEAIKNARISRGLYSCAICKTHMKNGEFKVDHIEPVVPLDGWDGLDWTKYVVRMFCGAEGFQIICDMCHDIKSDTEVQIRKMHRERKKAQKR